MGNLLKTWPFCLVAALSGPAAAQSATPAGDLGEVGSPHWIETFCDTTGGAVTSWKYLTTLCPNPQCKEYGKGVRGAWSAKDPDAFTCPACRERFPSARFSEEEHTVFGGLKFEYHTDPSGRRFFITPSLRYFKAVHALYAARDLARTAARREDAAAGRKALEIMLAFAPVYVRHIHIARGNNLYVAGWPNYCNWGRLDHFGDYVFPSLVCSIYENIAQTGAVTDANRRAYKELVEYMLAYVNFAFLKQTKGMGNFSVQIRRDCFKAVQTFPDLEIHDLAYEKERGGERVLRGADLVHEILEGEYGLLGLFGRYWYADGLMYERSYAYQEMLLTHLRLLLPEIAGYSDPPGYRPLDPRWTRYDNLQFGTDGFVGRCMREHFELSLPDQTMIPICDSYYGAKAKDLKTESTFHEGWGIGALRSGTGAGGALAALSWGSGRDGHSHNDMLNLILWAKGRLLVSDLAYVVDRTDIRERWWRESAAAHNTVVVDAENHTRARGDLVAWAAAPGVSVVQALSTENYPQHAELQRTVLLVGAPQPSGAAHYAVDVFHVAGGRTHDFFFHAQSGLDEPEAEFLAEGLALAPGTNPAGTLLDATPGAALEKAVGYEMIDHLRQGEATGPWNAVWRVGDAADVRLKLRRLDEDPETVFVGRAPGHRYQRDDKNPDLERRLHKLVCRRTTDRPPLRSCFTSVIEPFAGETGFVRGARRLKATGEGDPVAVEVDTGEVVDVIVVNARPGRVRVEERGISFDGRIAVVRFDREGQPRSALLVEGTGVQVGRESIRSGTATLSGRVVGHPSGLDANVLREENAGIEVDLPVPGEAVGRTLFLDHANGRRSGWTIRGVEPLPGGRHTRLTLDRSARQELQLLKAADPNGLIVTPDGGRHLEKGMWCRFGEEWRQVEGVVVEGETQKLRLSGPVPGVGRHAGGHYLVSYVGPGDTVTIPGITYWQADTREEKERK